jgi:hypothetical protein
VLLQEAGEVCLSRDIRGQSSANRIVSIAGCICVLSASTRLQVWIQDVEDLDPINNRSKSFSVAFDCCSVLTRESGDSLLKYLSFCDKIDVNRVSPHNEREASTISTAAYFENRCLGNTPALRLLQSDI